MVLSDIVAECNCLVHCMDSLSEKRAVILWMYKSRFAEPGVDAYAAVPTAAPLRGLQWVSHGCPASRNAASMRMLPYTQLRRFAACSGFHMDVPLRGTRRCPYAAVPTAAPLRGLQWVSHRCPRFAEPGVGVYVSIPSSRCCRSTFGMLLSPPCRADAPSSCGVWLAAGQSPGR